MALSTAPGPVDSEGREHHSYTGERFPVSFYYDDLDEVRISWHWHDEFELILVQEGKQTVLIGQDSFELEAGQGYFCNSGILHNSVPLSNRCIQKAVVFHPELIGEEGSVYYDKYVLPLLRNERLPYVRLDDSRIWKAEILEKLRSAWEAGVSESMGYELIVRALMGEILFSLLENSGENGEVRRSAALRRNENRVKDMLSFIKLNYASAITADDIASAADISISESLRCFRQILHTTPSQYLGQYRLRKAEELLRSTELAISEVAERCGFLDVSYFARAFRKNASCSPSEYRRRR